MSSHRRLRRAVSAALVTITLSAGFALEPPARAAALTSEDGQSNGIPIPGVDEVIDPADLQFPGTEPAAAGGTANGGYVMASSDGRIYSFGGAPAGEEARDFRLTKPVVDIAGTPSGRGYWLVAADGGIFSFGDAAYHGSTGNIGLKERITGMAATPSGHGYWLVAADGGIFSFGDAAFKGSTGDLVLTRPIVGMAATASGNGYWMVASDGGIFSFGDATFKGSTGNIKLAQPIVGMAATATGNGYWLGAADGGVFTFGDAVFKGSMSAGLLNGRIVGLMPQGGDVRAPVLRHFTFGPTSIDTSDGPAVLKFRANITDDLSGHAVDPPPQRWDRGETQVIFANPSGSFTRMGLNVFFRAGHRIAGDELDGIYRSYATVPANAASGTWRLSSISMSDAVGNMVIIDGATLAQAGFPTTFEQVGTGDVDPPEVASFSVTPDRIDTSAGPADVRISTRVVDGGTGVGSVSVGFSNRNTNVGTFLQRVSGNDHDGIYEGTVTVPRYAHQGWWAGGVQTLDRVGNINGFGANLPSVGFTQTGAGDEMPPRVLSVSVVGPTKVDASTGPATVKVRVHATDDLSGIAAPEPPYRFAVYFSSPSQQMVEGDLHFVSGTDRDAIYEATVTVPQYSEQGTWRLNQVNLRDRALNWTPPQVPNPLTFEVVRTENRA